jgi:cytochrome P450
MTGFADADYFTDTSLIDDPFPFFEYLRTKGPVFREPHHGVVVVTGYEEALAVYRDEDRFSNANAPSGPFPGLPFTPEGDDIGPQIEAHRGEMIYGDWLATRDPPGHTAYRALLTGLITPPRLAANEEFMWRLADKQIDAFLAGGTFEAQSGFARPFTILVLADLLGVPEADHKAFSDKFAAPPAQIGDERELVRNPLEFLDPIFTAYIEERRRNPLKDGLTELALAKFPDGSTPTITEIVNLTTFLFGAGQDTSARLIMASLRILGDRQDIQQLLRRERNRIPDFLEEVLRMEVPVKANFRLARVAAKVGTMDVKPGTTIMLLSGATNRDPRRFDHPAELRIDRKNVREHLSFGRGAHACMGAPLARAEARVSLNRLFDRLSEIRISESLHGPLGARRYSYDPTYLLRGLEQLHLEFTPERDVKPHESATRKVA